MPPRRAPTSHSSSRANSRSVVRLESTTNGPTVSEEEGKPSKTTTSEPGYTADEVQFLEGLRPPSREEKLLWLKDTWSSGPGLELLAGLTEKVLAMAALQIGEVSPPPPPEAAQVSGSNLPSSASTGDLSRREDPLRLPTAPGAGSIAEPVRPFSASLTPDQFVQENAYILEQLRALPECPFTIERLVEILEEPLKYHTGQDGVLRGEVLQAAIRRCIMVTCPYAGIIVGNSL